MTDRKYAEELVVLPRTITNEMIVAWFTASSGHTHDIDIKDPVIFSKVRELTELHTLDLSDAFQIISIKEGYFSHLVYDSQTVLVTADENLAKVARIEGVKSWYCLGEPEP